jgi:hypothetical protein
MYHRSSSNLLQRTGPSSSMNQVNDPAEKAVEILRRLPQAA